MNMVSNWLINLVWKVLNSSIPIFPIYLGTLKYYFNYNKIDTRLYSIISIISLLVIISQLNCLKFKEIMCQILPFILITVLMCVYMVYLLLHNRNFKTKKYDKHDILINFSILFYLTLFIIAFIRFYYNLTTTYLLKENIKKKIKLI